MMTQQNLFQQAVQCARAGRRAEAYNLMRQVLLEDPQFVPGWLWMSGLVDDPRQQRECLERALALDPHNAHAKVGLELLRLRALGDVKPPTPAKSAAVGGKIGEYLLREGIISRQQLDAALSEQKRRQSHRGEQIAVGDILIEYGWLTPHQLVASLMVQQQHKFQQGRHAPQRLGEYLVASGVISHELLGAVLTEQMVRRRGGENILLGELLLQGGYVTSEVLNRFLDEQFSKLFSSGG
jgi:hypothetical protein